MLRKALALALSVAALLGMALPPCMAAPKPAARPAARPAAAATHAAGPDARDPASLIALLAELSAKAQVARRDGDAVFLTVTSPTEIFSAQFAGCDPQGRSCQALLFDRQGAEGAPSLVQLNAFNQTSVMCRIYLDKSAKPHVEYSALMFPTTGRAEVLMHINAWRGCISDLNDFLKDPVGFLSQAA